jgi:DNA-binding NarL/FixJ family response regulator
MRSLAMNRDPVKQVLLADDHPVVLDGLQALLRTTQEFQVAAVCSNGLEALDRIRALEPDLTVLDNLMPDLSGVEIVETLNGDGIGTRVVLLSGSITDEQITRAADAGAWGIMLKDTAVEDLLDCLHCVNVGRRWLPRDVVHAAFEREAARREDKEEYTRVLTSREQEIAALVAQGLSNKHIARKTGISDGTVKIHLHNIFQKLGISNRTALAMKTQRELNRLG